MEEINTLMKNIIKNILLCIPIVNKRVERYNYLNKIIYNAGFEPGHFYSPIPNIAEIEKNADIIFSERALYGIDLNPEAQIQFLETFKTFYSDYIYNKENTNYLSFRYKKEGAFYRFSDSVFLYSIMRHFKPKKIIEVGSGHSSALMLDVNEYFFKNNIHFTFIEPYPEIILAKILKESDKTANTIIKGEFYKLNL